MPPIYRLRSDNSSGTAGATLGSGDTTLDLGGDPGWATFGADDYRVLVLSQTETGVDEKVWVVAPYTAGATSCTIQRGKEGTTAVAHSPAPKWRHVPTPWDYDRGRLLATKYGSQGGDYSTTVSTFADVDGTNLAATVTPRTPSCLVTLQAFISNSGGIAEWAITNAADVVQGFARYAIQDNENNHAMLSFQIDGLTPGTSVTFKWRFRKATGGATHTISNTNTANRPVMRIYEVAQ